MTAMRTSLGLDSIEDICIEGIRKNTDRSSVYYKTQPLFSGHFQEVGAPAAPAATGTPLPPPASAPWSIIRTDQASFHYKGTPDRRSESKAACKAAKAHHPKEQSSSRSRKSAPPGFILIIEHHAVTFYFAVLPDVPLASHAGVLSVLRD